MDIEKNIKQKLEEIEQIENIKIIMAVESGSRAWGFASPDSDYDVRFIYARKKEDYLSLDEPRDVVEWQLDDVYDVNGWDLKKALKLLYKANPSVFEWCTSPIVYRDTKEFNDLKELLPLYFNQKKSLYHYWHMAKTNYREHIRAEQVKLKKYFYVLRPILAAEWVLEYATQPPMEFDRLVKAQLPDELRPVVDDLLEKKMAASEMGMAPRIDVLNEFIEKEIERIEEKAASCEDKKVEWDALNDYFRKIVMK